MAGNQRVLAWGDQAVPRAPRQERANGAPHPNHPANQGGAQVRVIREGSVVVTILANDSMPSLDA